MTEQKKLKELTNSIRITGILKENNLEIKPNKKDPSVRQIMGNIVILSVVGDKVNEHRVELFAKESSKLFKGYETIMKECKSIEVHGKENATKLTVTGSIDGNDYVGQDGVLKEYNRIRGLFVNRVDDPTTVKDEALAQIALVVTNIRPKTNKDGEETGEYGIDGFTIGYNNSVIVLQNLVVGENLANVITENYEIGCTGQLTFQINNYVEVIEKEVDPFAGGDAGFGIQVDLGNEARNYNRNLLVIGGFPPYLDERALDEDDIILAKQIRALHIQEVMNSVPATPPQGGGFGQQGFADPFKGDGKPIDISDDDLPF